MKVISLKIPGCFKITNTVHRDHRGSFTKEFSCSMFSGLGLRNDFREEYHTVSVDGVIRGMHLQVPPHDHTKLVYCVGGAVLDVLVDLRVGSHTYGKTCSVELDEDSGVSVYIPRGVAHGFCVRRGPAVLVYKTTSEHHKESDTGVRWDSIGFCWPVLDPITSSRDKELPILSEFKSPFIYNGDPVI